MLMHTRKHNAMMAAYTGFRGTQTLGKVLEQIPEPMCAELTGKQLGQVASLLYAAYAKGKADAGASIEDDCVYVGAGVNRLIPLSIIRALPEGVELA